MKSKEKRLQMLEEKIFIDDRKVLYLNTQRDVLDFDKIVRNGKHKDYKVYVGKEAEPYLFILYMKE